MPLGMGDWEEIGWCPICADETWCTNNGEAVSGHTPAHFYDVGSNHMHPCPSCKEKGDRVLAIKAEITALNQKILSIVNEIYRKAAA